MNNYMNDKLEQLEQLVTEQYSSVIQEFGIPPSQALEYYNSQFRSIWDILIQMQRNGVPLERIREGLEKINTSLNSK